MSGISPVVHILANPPPLHGAARWATRADVVAGNTLADRDRVVSDGRGLLVGGFHDPDPAAPAGDFLLWDGDGHLMTLAPTRSGKARTTIIPNLLRYKGSAVVLDPKGELYEATSAWRAANVGPVYRIAPFDVGADPATAGFPRHGFNPLAGVTMNADQLALARLMFPRDPKSPAFFNDDAVGFMNGLLAYVRAKFPPDLRTLADAIEFLFMPNAWIIEQCATALMNSDVPAARDAATSLLGKDPRKGGPSVLLETIRSALGACWNDPEVMASMRGPSVDFTALKSRPATVYIELPFAYMSTFSPYLRVVIKAALDAMTRTRQAPDIPVLFVLDEFLQLQHFPEALDAMRTLAGSGVRMWFFLQDLAGLEQHYGDGWRALMTCAVRQYFGTNDLFTAELVSRDLGVTTAAHRNISMNSNWSAQQPNPWWNQGSSGSGSAGGGSSDSIHLFERSLLTPGEVMMELASWGGKGWRNGIVQISTLAGRPAKARLLDYSHSPTWAGRIGAWKKG
jgi:type IV secretion system protein VirD4